MKFLTDPNESMYRSMEAMKRREARRRRGIIAAIILGLLSLGFSAGYFVGAMS